MASEHQPMWVIRGTEIVRVRNVLGYPPAPCVEGTISRPVPQPESADGL